MFALKINIYLLDENSEIEYRISGIKDSYVASQNLLNVVARVIPTLTTDELTKLQGLVQQVSTGTRQPKCTLSCRVNLKVALRKE